MIVTHTFTIEQIKEIYNAGVRRGEETATAYQCGSRAFGKHYDECVEAIHDIVNKDVKFDDPDKENMTRCFNSFVSRLRREGTDENMVRVKSQFKELREFLK